MHADTSRLTNALQEFFAGKGAMGFFDAHTQTLSGLRGLIETVHQHGVEHDHEVLGDAINTHNHIRGLF